MAALRFGLMSLALWLCALAVPAFAQGPGPHVRIELAAESLAPAAGSEVTLGFASVPDPGWHAYWRNPGDAGIPPTLKWTLPAGVAAGDLEFPVPQTLMIAGLMNYVYEGPFAPLVKLRIPAGLAPGTKLPIAVRYDYLVCTEEICVPEKAELATVLTVGDGAVDSARRARFDGWRAAMPRPLGAEATYQVDRGGFRLSVPFPASAEGAGQIYFFPATDGAIEYAAPQKAVREGDRIVVETGGRKEVGPIEGVLAFGKERGFALRAVPGRVAAAKAGPGGGAVAGGDRGVRGGGARRAAAQHHAVRLPDPQPQGAEPRQGQ